MRRLPALVLLLLALPARAQTAPPLQAQLRQMFADQILTLRTFYSGDRLRFDPLGLPLEAGPPGPWTLDSQVRVSDLALTPTALVLTGRRQHFLFSLGHFHHHNDGEVTIELQLPQPLRTRADATRVLARVFLYGDQTLSDFVPSYWKFLLTGAWKTPEEALADFLPGETIYQPGSGGVSALEPAGRGQVGTDMAVVCGRPEGDVELVGVVGRDGSVQALQVVAPIGLGLDDRAAEVVGKWRFRPAKKDGRPVAVEIRVVVYFRRDAC